MKEAFRRMNALAYQLEQAYAEGILNKTVMGQILDKLQDYTEWYIQYEQYRQLEEWYQVTGQENNGRVLQSIEHFPENESEEDVIYREYIKSLPEGL